jgi:aspartyl-tRNA(Asn)/glutamyl-tRNA(Gln) amidotransferase subunit B
MRGVKIGLEIHVQLVSLKTKLFCPCPSDYRGKPPNTNVCPVCLGLPGTLPVLNERAVEEGVKVALALSAKVHRTSYFYRKNYFYPDLAKNFQITQYDKAGGVPLASGGYLRLGNGKKIRIRRIQLEEDPGRIYYEVGIQEARYSLIDYNRHGIALMEIVTEPDFSDPKEAREFLEKLATLLEELGIPVGSYEGAIRCDANISLKDGYRVEVKNITGFSAVEKALNFEITRQGNLLKRGIRVLRETRHWDERRRITTGLRRKEMEEDYRYFPEPDLPPLIIDESLIERLKESVPKPIEEVEKEFRERYGIEEAIAIRLVQDRRLRRLFQEASGLRPELAKGLASVLVNELSFLLKREEPDRLPENVEGLIEAARAKEDSAERKVILEILKGWMNGKQVRYEARKEEVDVLGLARAVIDENPKAVEEARRNPKAVNYLMGLAIRKAPNVDKRRLYEALLSELGLKPSL